MKFDPKIKIRLLIWGIIIGLIFIISYTLLFPCGGMLEFIESKLERTPTDVLENIRAHKRTGFSDIHEMFYIGNKLRKLEKMSQENNLIVDELFAMEILLCKTSRC